MRMLVYAKYIRTTMPMHLQYVVEKSAQTIGEFILIHTPAGSRSIWQVLPSPEFTLRRRCYSVMLIDSEKVESMSSQRCID